MRPVLPRATPAGVAGGGDQPRRVCLSVTARFAGRRTLEVDSWWPLLLDGLLAGVLRQPRAKPNQTVALPLGRHYRDAGKQWYWMASVAGPLGPGLDRSWVTRFDRAPGPVELTCEGLEWRAVGHLDAVRAAVGAVASLGNRDARALVSHWEVHDAGEESDDWTTWLASGLIARPVPARVALSLGVPDADTVDGPLRPPYWRPPPRGDGHGFERAWREVLAPWTLRPRS